MLLVVAALGWYGYNKYQGRFKTENRIETEAKPAKSSAASSHFVNQGASAFKYDGRTHFSQMTSCAEAKYFLQNCPDTKMTETTTAFLARNSGANSVPPYEHCANPREC